MNTSTFVPRPAQEQVLAYTGGYMGISAVPGSGKTFTLSLLAARLVERLAHEGDTGDREVLVVTFTNSAAENFRQRIGQFLRDERGLLPGAGYRVRTLHGLAHDIVRERPALVGLSESFDLIDERISAEIKRESAITYLRSHPDLLSPYIHPDYMARLRGIERDLSDTAVDIANVVIRLGKEWGLEPYQLRSRLDRQSGAWPLLELGLHVYADYQRSLLVRGAIDFDDLIILARKAFDADDSFLARMQDRWPYVLEDEAQDSSPLQEYMLRTLTGKHGNWVRVGDPNQAINTTFTGADPRFLRQFIEDHIDLARDLPNSGRSARPIIDLANALINWSRMSHPHLRAEDRLAPPLIEPTPFGDPQPNPEAGSPPFYFHATEVPPDREIEIVVRSVARWLPENPDKTIAILAPENHHGFRITEALQNAGLPFDDTLLRSNLSTRVAAHLLAVVVNYIAHPQLAKQLAQVWSEVWWPRLGPPQLARLMRVEQGIAVADDDELPIPSSALRKQEVPEPVEKFTQELEKLTRPESFVFPSPRDWLDELAWLDDASGLRPVVNAFRMDLQRWTRASILPIDELILTIGAELFTEPADLALTHHLAVELSKLAAEHATSKDQWRLPELAKALEEIAQNKRRVMSFSENEGGYEAQPARITVATMHAAKGREWDRVYLTSLNTFSFPSGSESDPYRSERFWVRDRLNLVAESMEQLRQLAAGSLDDYATGPATQAARLDLAAERLRLFYVGITRARRELIITYNTGRAKDKPSSPALAFEALAALQLPQNHN